MVVRVHVVYGMWECRVPHAEFILLFRHRNVGQTKCRSHTREEMWETWLDHCLYKRPTSGLYQRMSRPKRCHSDTTIIVYLFCVVWRFLDDSDDCHLSYGEVG